MGMSANIEKQLKDAALTTGLPILTLSKRSGVCYSGLHGFMTGDRKITLEVAARLATVLGLELRSIRRTKRK